MSTYLIKYINVPSLAALNGCQGVWVTARKVLADFLDNLGVNVTY